MVAELPGSGTLAAMMLLGAIVAAMLVAMAVCLVYGWNQMRHQEKVVKITETVMDLPTRRIAVRAGTKYHRKGCGTNDVNVTPWQALGYNNKRKVKEELALGDGRTFKEVSRGRKEKRHEENDESELMAVWTSRLRKPNTHYERYEFYLRNHNVCTVTADDTDLNTIRNKNAYTIKDYVEIGKSDATIRFALRC
eukprot:s8106_g1.t1